MADRTPPLGVLLRTWRGRRRISQMDLAHQAGVSPRHLSFVETGRAKPSREMVLHLADQLDVPLRDRNGMLLAAGFAPAFRETDLSSPEMAPVREALGLVLAGHEPYPAVVVDRHWDLVMANQAASLFLAGVDPALLGPPLNVLRLTFHPDGLGSRIVNLGEWADHTISRLEREAMVTGRQELTDLAAELKDLIAAQGAYTPAPEHDPLPAITMRLATDDGELAFIATVATFGTPVDVTLDELAIEAFLPADRHTAEVLRTRAGLPTSQG
ncbi:MAG TPA: helix-turn-helix transcriptional regulator [Iamia sp.]|nr:helix-turn-helix transcriptional regulator [Iamia sp.]